MNPTNPLDSVYFINLGEKFKLSDNALQIDPTIPLPVQKKDSEGPGSFDMSELTEEQKNNKKIVDRISTDEIYNDISNGGKITQNFLLNIILSSIVCSIGIIKQDVSILIASSTIAPFLGSILAYSFSLSLDKSDIILLM